MNYKPEKNVTKIKEAIDSKLSRYFSTTPDEANDEQMYKAVVLSVKDILTQKYSKFNENVKKQSGKRVYYLCMEFLIGRSLKNNLQNLGMLDSYSKVLSEYGYSLDDIYLREPDPGLGNGGLGRLAACYMDSLTTLEYPATGFSICYEYGLFKQKIVDGDQIELPDIWMPGGDVWLVPRPDKTYSVKFGGHVNESWENGELIITHDNYDEVQAIPHDMMISGSNSEAVNVLRLWQSKDITRFSMALFSQGQYIKAVQENTNAETISKVLYPSDDHIEGKLLRLSQQYFLVSASLQNIIGDHLAIYGTLSNFSNKVVLHINDTHPALCIPELMRILMDTYSYTWENAWYVVKKTVSYTNHTILPEALETWNEDLFRLSLPRIYSIINEINRRFCAQLWKMYPGDWDRISRMSIIGYSQVRMANLSVIGSYRVNGVSKLHSDILKDTVFNDFYKITPEKFTNVTNGIAHRRWLCYSNPKLATLLDETIGDKYREDPSRLIEFKKFYGNADIINRLDAIKIDNKVNFSKYVFNKMGISLDPSSIFDVQIKRMHEYKRQLLNAIRIISLYLDLKENPNLDVQPQTFIFAAKAAPNYPMAKQIIKLISFISADIEKDIKMREKLRVIFMEDYNVSLAEILIPASDISEQISLAGKEASGTGNMKLMINGAVTIGTLDGANVEIFDAVGKDNIFIFGLDTNEVDDLWKRGYTSSTYFHNNERLRKAIDYLNIGFNGYSFSNIVNYLLIGYGISDPYMCLADFDSYYKTHEKITKMYQNRTEWNNMSLVNIASAGRFAADRSIREYAENIWHVNPIYTK